ncbi:alginate export family protein [Methylobacillus sp.]|uniref:alginate export family protein n=1 Tax=Methylobacillus sp. TaxID=56818 RepID=UPI0012CAD854|nr:alginate export family protein [Methylobacillus sp.]MPS49942.1 hypothetical protein [Methylobacillus sp.]
MSVISPTARLGMISALLGITAFSAQAEERVPQSFMEAIKAGKSLSSLRLRYEHVDQDGLQPPTIIGAQANPTANEDLRSASALTLRTLLGWQTAPYQNISFAGQLINVTKFIDNFNDGTNGVLIDAISNNPSNIDRAKIVDPDITEINQLYVDWTGLKDTRIRFGRQQINLDNFRFIGDVIFRQVMQVFDGVTMLNQSISNTELYVGHIERVRQLTTELRDDGALEIINMKYRLSPTESLSGYGYFSSFDDLGFGRAWFGNAAGTAGIAQGKNGAINQEADQGNKIIGVRLDGVHPVNQSWKGLYTAEYAKQTDYSGGDSRIDAHYYKIGGGFAYNGFSLRADQELLSSNDGQYGFQMPYGTNHLFQGWVDKFLSTPQEGIKDTFITAGYKAGNFTFFMDYHILDSDVGFNTVGGGTGSRLGKEWNASVTYNFAENWMARFEYGSFKEGDHYTSLPAANTVAGNRGRFRDTEKTWVTLMYSF